MDTGTVVVLALVALLAWFVISLIWGKPWSVRLLYLRTFLHYALKGPELLTMLGILEKFGIHGHNAKLSDASVAFETKTYQWVKRDLRILRSYGRQFQSPTTLISSAIMDWFLDDVVRGEVFRFHDYPVNQMFGIQSELPNFMLTLHPVVSKREARNYIQRLNAFGVKFDQVLEGLQIREARGIIPPYFVIQRVLNEMTAFVGQPARQNPLYRVFGHKLARLDRLTAADRKALLASAEEALREVVYPAYRKLVVYFDALAHKASLDDGVWKLPEGDAYYAYRLRSSTTTELTPDEIHAIGLREVTRIEAEMAAILQRLGYSAEPSAPRRLAELAQEERFQYPNTDEGRKACLDDYRRILSSMNAALDPVFTKRPKAALKVRRIPEFREKTSAGAYYQPADLGGGRPGVFYVNLRNMAEVRKFGMKTLAYHEGIPGHHFQLATAQELRNVPFFRRMLPFTAYAEGWALYAEKLAREMGAYKDDPYSELGYLDSELLRAVRLVVDTGIHAKRWTREKAIAYMEAHTASAHDSVVSEVERYIVMPGQACAYKIGEIKILALREKARQALGERFDLRQFHDMVLRNGAMPLTLLEQVVDAAIRNTQ